MTDDQRKFPRLNWNVEVCWKKTLDIPNKEPQNTSATKDISAGGIRLILGEGVGVGDILELQINLGGGKSICSRGRVTWVDKFEITGGIEKTGYEGGVEFLDMNDETMQQINQFIFELRKKTP